MIATSILAAALMAALFLIVSLLRELRKVTRTMEKSTQRWMSARKTLAQTKQANEALMAETMFLKTVIRDIAKGEAHVWIGEDGEVVAARTAVGEIQIH